MPTEDEQTIGQSRLRLVANASDWERREHVRRQALLELRHPFAKLASNVLRIVRGAGKPEMLLRDCLDVIRAADAYSDEVGSLPSYLDVQECLRLGAPRDGFDEEFQDRAWAKDRAVRGALQFAASSLMDQKAQISAGEYELLLGMRGFARLEEEARKRYEAAAREAAKAQRKPSKRRKPQQKRKTV